MDTFVFTKSASTQCISTGGGSSENGEYGQKWSLELSQKDATSLLEIRSGNQSPEESGCTVCGPLKVRLKRHREQPTAPAASTELTLEVVPGLGSEPEYYLEDDCKPTPSTVAKSSQTEPAAVSNYDSTTAPGSKVSLNGIVWMESASGLLVLRDVVWRGRRYAGALMPEETTPAALGSSKTTRRRGGCPRRRRRGRHDREHRRECQPIACNQRPLLVHTETVSKESLITELSCDGSVVYRVPVKRPRTTENSSDDPEENVHDDRTKKVEPDEAEVKECSTSVQVTEKTSESDEAEDVGDKYETSVKSKAVCAYSDISDDDETGAPVTTPLGAPSTALSHNRLSAEFHTGPLAAYARFLLQQQQQRLMGMPK